MLTFIIHNESDLTRKQSYLKEFEEQNIVNYIMMPAIMEPKMPRRGISRSHKACVQIAKDRNEPCVHIMEDDIWFLQKGSYKRFLNIYVEIPKDCDMFFAGNYTGEFTPINDKVATSTDKIAGMICYIVNAHFYDKFLAADENYNIDHFLTARDLTNAKCYTAYPMLALQYDGFSYNTMMDTQYNPEMHRRYKLWDGIIQ